MPSKIEKLRVVSKFPTAPVEAASEEDRRAAEHAWDETEMLCQEVERNLGEIAEIMRAKLWEIMRDLGYDHRTLCLVLDEKPSVVDALMDEECEQLTLEMSLAYLRRLRPAQRGART